MSIRLFTRSALRYHANHQTGKLRLASPPSVSMTVALLISTLCIASIFIATQSYPKKVRTLGFIHLDDIRISVESTGIIESLRVKTGDTVSQGQIIGQIASTRRPDVSQNQLSKARVNNLSDHRRLIAETYEINDKIVSQQLSQSRVALVNIASLLGLQTLRVERQIAVINKTRPLWQKGYISDLQWSAIEGQLHSLQQQALELAQRKTNENNTMVALENQRVLLKAELDRELSVQNEKELLLESILKDRMYNLGETLYAPVAGTITNIFRQTGDRVLPSAPILSISEVSKPLHARILISQTMSGQIVSGQQVHMRLHAFPPTNFGTLKGELLSISTHPVSAVDLPRQIQQPGKFYLGLVSLPFPHGDNDSIHLKPGMTFSADVILGERNLYTLVFEPLLSAVHVSGILSE